MTSPLAPPLRFQSRVAVAKKVAFRFARKPSRRRRNSNRHLRLPTRVFPAKSENSLRQPQDAAKQSASAAAREGSTCGIQATGFDMIIVMLRQHWRWWEDGRCEGGAESRQS